MIHGVGINDLHYSKAGNRNTDYEKRVYVLWCSMIHRCYSKLSLQRNQCYKDVEVCEEWLTLSNFARDIKYLKGYYLWKNNPNKKISLDKDILAKDGKRIYSPETCCFVSMLENIRRKHEFKERFISKEKEELINRQQLRRLKCTHSDGTVRYYPSQNAATKDGFDLRAIYKCCKGLRKSHHGCKFELIHDACVVV